MRIERAHLHRIRLRLKAPFKTSFGEEWDRECLILSLKAEGLTGWGECAATAEPGYSYETVGTAWHILRDFFLPALFADEISIPEVWPERLRGYRGHPMARAAVEMALWDLWGKLEGRSFRELIGGERERVPVGVSIGIQESPERMLEMVESFLSAGYRRMKLKIAPGADVQIVGMVRERHPDLALWVDANAAYTLEDRKVFLTLDRLSLGLIEQPLAEDDLLGHRGLQSLLQTPVCLDESVHNAREASQALALDACRVINIKPARVGGFVEARAIEQLCQARQVPVWCGGMLETGIGRAANLALASRPGFVLPGDISASDRYYAEDIAQPLFELNPDSTIDVPKGPGLGVEVDETALRKHALTEEQILP